VEKHSRRLFRVLLEFQQLLFFSRTFHCLNWGRFAQFRPLCLSGPAPLWYVIALPLVCRVPHRASNYINEPRSSGRPRAPVAPDQQQSLLLGAQHIKDFMILNAPCQTKCWIRGSALCINLISDIGDRYNCQKAKGKAFPVFIYEVRKFIIDWCNVYCLSYQALLKPRRFGRWFVFRYQVAVLH